MKAVTATVTTPGRYRAVAAFEMTDDAQREVTKALKVAGCTVGRCKRGGLVVERDRRLYRLTDEQDAPPLTLKGVVELIG